MAVISVNWSAELVRAALDLPPSAVARSGGPPAAAAAAPVPAPPRRRGWLQCLTPWNQEVRPCSCNQLKIACVSFAYY
eukprot:1176876-Prorocentrum_minimum.AAC.3